MYKWVDHHLLDQNYIECLKAHDFVHISTDVRTVGKHRVPLCVSIRVGLYRKGMIIRSGIVRQGIREGI